MSPDPTPLPRWVRAVDALTVALVLLGLLVTCSGGARFEPFGIEISLRSGVRPLLLAAVLAAVRHLLDRRLPLPARLAAALLRTWRTPVTRSILQVSLVTRFAVLVVGYFAVVTVGLPPPDQVPFRISRDELLNLPARFDSGWYYHIATFGYEFDPAQPGQQNIAFFPAYPLLMRYVGRLLRIPQMAAGLIVSFGAFLAALTYLFALARQHLDEDHAAAGIVMLAAYPFAIFFSAVYTEALFLLGAVAAISHLTRGQPLRAAAWGGLVGLTRPNGFLLTLPLAVVAIQPVLAARTSAARRWWWVGQPLGETPARSLALPALLARVAAAAAPVAGALIYLGYLYAFTGDPSTWLKVQSTWGRTYQGIAGVASSAYRYMIEYGVLESVTGVPYDALNAAAAMFAIALVWPVTRRFGLAYGLFVAVNVVAPLLAGGVLSLGRMTSVLFPMFLWLGAVVPARQRPIWAVVFGMGQALAAVLFFTWRPLF